MSDPISSLLQRSLTGTNSPRSADASAKSAGSAGVAKTGTTTTSTVNTTAALPVDELDVAFLAEKADSIAKVLQNISDSVSTIRDTQGRLTQITSLLEQAGGIAVRARDTLKAAGDDSTSVSAKLDELSTRFAKVLADIDQVAGKADTAPNLLQGENLTTSFDSEGKVAYDTPGIFIGSSGLGLYPIAYAEATPEEADDVRAQVTNSLDQLKLFRQQLGSDLNVLQTRQDFSLNAMQILSTDQIAVLPSSAEESANLLALQLRQQLAGSDATLAGESARALLRQF